MKTSYMITLIFMLGLMAGCDETSDTVSPTADTQAPIPSGVIAAMAEEITPLGVGDQVPDVTVRTIDGDSVSLKSQLAEKPTVLIFYRGGWCPFCNRHLSSLQSIQAQVLEAGWQIIAISPDRPAKLTETLNEQDLSYTLLSDSPMAAARAFGLAFQVDDATLQRYKGYGIDLDDASGESHHALPVPAVFLVTPQGQITYVYTNPDYKVRLDAQEILARL